VIRPLSDTAARPGPTTLAVARVPPGRPCVCRPGGRTAARPTPPGWPVPAAHDDVVRGPSW